MKCHKVASSNAQLLQVDSPDWGKAEVVEFNLAPTPLAMVTSKSPYLAQTSHEHGAVRAMRVSALHNGNVISIKIAWKNSRRSDKIADLDQFTDAVAVLFPLTDKPTSATTMGAKDRPVSAWFYQTHRKEAFDVLAEGFGTSVRRPGHLSGLVANAGYSDGGWQVVFQRPLIVKTEQAVQMKAGRKSAVAFAVWDGSNHERSGQKSFSGEFFDFQIQA